MSYVIACDVGKTVDVWDEDLPKLEEGEYDELSSWKHITTRGNRVRIRIKYTLRRVS